MTDKEECKIASNLDTNFLKLVAIFAMTCDHVGKFLLPDLLFLQIIGRIAFPIFAYCIVVGSVYTHDIKKYFLRLAVFAFISQPFSVLAAHSNWNDFVQNLLILNIFFTLMIGLAAIYAMKEHKWWLFILLIFAANFINIDYGISGILLIIVFYLFRNERKISIAFSAIMLAAPFFNSGELSLLGRSFDIQGFAVLALPLIYIKTNFNLKINKYLFYAFYPMHLLAIFLIKVALRIG